MFTELLAHPGVQEVCELRSTVGFMAFHGGLEAHTEVVARSASDACGASYYAVIQPKGFRWHVPSNAFRPVESPRLASFVDHVGVALALHGYFRRALGPTILLGGTNRELALLVGAALRDRQDEIQCDVIEELSAIPVELRGVHPENPVNLPPGGGVQVELTPRVREPGPRRDALVAALADAATRYGASRTDVQPSGVRR
jgi:phage replication-related protein YjqB (UPF0714/DUF867 family)